MSLFDHSGKKLTDRDPRHRLDVKTTHMESAEKSQSRTSLN